MPVSPKKKENRDTARLPAEAFEGTKGRDSIPGKEVCTRVRARVCRTREGRLEAKP